MRLPQPVEQIAGVVGVSKRGAAHARHHSELKSNSDIGAGSSEWGQIRDNEIRGSHQCYVGPINSIGCRKRFQPILQLAIEREQSFEAIFETQLLLAGGNLDRIGQEYLRPREVDVL